MRTFLLSIFWISSVGNVVQALIMLSAGWVIFAGDYAFANLSVEVFVTQVAPWLRWVETVVIALLGDFGRWLLSIPILIIAPLKFIAGALIGWWAYTAAQNIPPQSAYT